NAVWDLYAKAGGKPVWKLVVDMTPEQLVSCIDFHYITDVLTPEEALAILRTNAATRHVREAAMLRDGFPAYTTSAGWLGYADEKIRRLCREGVAAGWTHFKIKVGADLEDDIRRLDIVRQEIGPNRKLMVDANQKWDVGEAIDWMSHLKRFDPWWIEDRILEYVDHLHEHFLDPVRIRNGRYMPPAQPGYSITMRPESLDAHEFPHGKVWASFSPQRREDAKNC